MVWHTFQACVPFGTLERQNGRADLERRETLRVNAETERFRQQAPFARFPFPALLGNRRPGTSLTLKLGDFYEATEKLNKITFKV